jgi:hypothetical protein
VKLISSLGFLSLEKPRLLSYAQPPLSRGPVFTTEPGTAISRITEQVTQDRNKLFDHYNVLLLIVTSAIKHGYC